MGTPGRNARLGWASGRPRHSRVQPKIIAGRGQLSISAYQAGLSAVTAVLEASIDQGVTWFSIPATLGLTGTGT